MKNAFTEIFTDALGRPEVKNMVGVPMLITGAVVGILMLIGVVPANLTDWSVYMGFAAGLVTVTAIADAKIDASTIDKGRGSV